MKTALSFGYYLTLRGTHKIGVQVTLTSLHLIMSHTHQPPIYDECKSKWKFYQLGGELTTGANHQTAQQMFQIWLFLEQLLLLVNCFPGLMIMIISALL